MEFQWGSSLKAGPAASLIHFHKAYLLNDYGLVRSLIDTDIKLLKLNPRVFADRVKLAENAIAKNDLTGAAAEYSLALNLKEDPNVRKKLDAILEQLPPYFRKPNYENRSTSEPSFHTETNLKFDPAYGDYLRIIENKIKIHWAPESESISRRVVARFDISSSGAPSNFIVAHSSHDQRFDDQVLRSIVDAGNFGNLQKGNLAGLTVQVAFDYDAISKAKRVEAEAQILLQSH